MGDIKLYVNVIGTAFRDFWGSIKPWYEKTFSHDERYKWAVLDLHWYAAWSLGRCDGRVVLGGKYVCDQPTEEVRSVLRTCATEFARDFVDNADGLRSISEFSVGTFHDAVLACNDPRVL